MAMGNVAKRPGPLNPQSPASKAKLRFFLKKNLNAHLDLLSIPQSGGKSVKTFRWDHRLQRRNLFMVS